MARARAGQNVRPTTWFAATPLAARMIIAALTGGVGGFAQAPYGLPLILVMCAALAFFMFGQTRTPRAAAALGWAFGAGYFAHTLFWIVEPFQVDSARHGWMAPFALAFMAGGLALFWSVAFWGARKLSARTWPLVFAWAAAELGRAYLFTGFPWAGVSQIVVDGMAARILAWAGPHGTTLWLFSIAWALSLRAGRHRQVMRVAQIVLLLAVGVGLQAPTTAPPAGLTEHTVRLVQPNAPQHLKWQPDMALLYYQRQLTFTEAAPAEGKPRPDLVVWPETAVPWRLGQADSILEQIASVAGGTPVVLGILRVEEAQLRNAMVLTNNAGAPSAIYDKHHLVPFGEYLPFAQLARRFGLRGLVEARGAGFAPGSGAAIMDFGVIGQGVPLICYEAVFAHDVNRAPGRADFILQITNDAWFGDWAGPQQHLAQARMRAIEQGLPMMRAANTGISAMIDPYGRVTASLELGIAGFVDARLPQPLGPTLYNRVGDFPVLLLLLAGFGVAAMKSRANVSAGHVRYK
ncbi:MAG: apolipoprotein N-acyltransferase [Pseudomonadota bacterium]